MFSTIAFNGAINDKQTLIDDPDLLETDGFYAFASALWFWMTP